jgi:hypothetical protein
MCGVVGAGLAVGFLYLVLASPAKAQTAPALSEADTRELIDAAKATGETVDYIRVTPD